MADDLETWYTQHRVLEYYQVCLNDDPGFDLDLFYGKVKFGPLSFCMGKR